MTPTHAESRDGVKPGSPARVSVSRLALHAAMDQEGSDQPVRRSDSSGIFEGERLEQAGKRHDGTRQAVRAAAESRRHRGARSGRAQKVSGRPLRQLVWGRQRGQAAHILEVRVRLDRRGQGVESDRRGAELPLLRCVRRFDIGLIQA
jgi:hypothetical protein